MTIDEVIVIAERGIEEAHNGYSGTLELEAAVDAAEYGSEAWHLADLMRVFVEQIEMAASELTDTVATAQKELQSYRKKATA